MIRQVSIAFQTDKTPAEYVALARLVDGYDFDVVSVYCDAPYHPSYGPLLLMAPHIRRARLGPAAVSPFRMHPIDIAANTALLAGTAAGGVYIGLARGAWLAQHGIREPERPIAAMRETVDIMRRLLSGESIGYTGDVYSIAPHVKAPYPLPEGEIPIMIGTWGRKLAALAGEMADEVKVGGSANPELAPIIGAYIHEGEKRAGRDKGSVRLVVGAVTVVDEERDRARRAAKEALALYLPVVAPLDPTVESDPELLALIADYVQYEEMDKARALISDELLERFAFAGDAQDLIRQAEALFDVGVSRVEFGTPHGLEPEKGIRLIGEQVLPALKRN